MNDAKFQLANLELYLPDRHGIVNSIDKSIYKNYLILYSYNLNNFYNNFDEILIDIKIANEEYSQMDTIHHPDIRNYNRLISNTKHLELKIIEPINIYFGKGKWDYYSTGIDKTIWIKLIQRRWRNIQKKRLQLKMNIKSLRYREINGIWPKECHIPFKLGI